ncbi:hypothetical protein CDG81_02785 [Actinopolyspora erythraea]|uniref:DUF3040 domain-containing protein n=1 Tax=Actinopolyspora erythraea TaxID=414996 RepID=A0A099D4W3_9ACTN|nr:hypothetical protein [Actinopolyspora erythraea]ASU77407.1 hypothetical protein CDG81_02785 [Actinopolyspora erythraea]KGI80380.1 hypothetical protein IL38_18195 [Actinopolyspora erythraea]
MSPSARVLFLVGVVSILVALFVGAVLLGVGYVTWIAGTIGAISIAAGFVARALSPDSGGGKSTGDGVVPAAQRSRNRFIGRSLPGVRDRIWQRHLESKGDPQEGEAEDPERDSPRPES